MHHEQNFAKTFLKTIIGEKYNVKVQQNLQWRGIKPHLWLITYPQGGGKMLKLAAPYVLTAAKFDVFASIIKNLKTPSSHVSMMAQ
jgi:hypothetical protein